MEIEDNGFEDFVVNVRKYKTHLTPKFLNRKKWKKPFIGDILSNLPGTVISLKVVVGQTVSAGDLLLIHEAMKMQNRIVAPIAGEIESINVVEGEKVPKDHLMVKIKPI